MNTLVLVFHPHLHDGSRINRTLAETAAATPGVTVRDESSPALLKQWEDTVLRHGWAFGTGGDKLHGKELMAAVSVGGSSDKYRHDGEFGVIVPELLKPLEATAKHIGMTWLEPFTIHGTMKVTDEELDEAARQYAALLTA